jgi:hypothetical protein
MFQVRSGALEYRHGAENIAQIIMKKTGIWVEVVEVD